MIAADTARFRCCSALRARSLLALCLLVVSALPGLAQGPPSDRRPNEPGQFDYYVLSLSWSPSFCAEAAERSHGHPPKAECGTRAYSFIVHGLWPQYRSGFPQDCQVPAPRLDRRLVAAMSDLMPSRRLVYNEWDRHGTCSGLSPRSYFETVRKARAAVKIPPEYLDVHRLLSVAPGAVEASFVAANPGLASGDLAVECNAGWLTEVRLCLSKDLQFRACPDVVRHDCRRAHVLMPPVRGTVADAAGKD